MIVHGRSELIGSNTVIVPLINNNTSFYATNQRVSTNHLLDYIFVFSDICSKLFIMPWLKSILSLNKATHTVPSPFAHKFIRFISCVGLCACLNKAGWICHGCLWVWLRVFHSIAVACRRGHDFFFVQSSSMAPSGSTSAMDKHNGRRGAKSCLFVYFQVWNHLRFTRIFDSIFMCHVLLITSMPAKTTVISFPSSISHAIYIRFLQKMRGSGWTLHSKRKSGSRVINCVGNSYWNSR
jgi:hypothetical protein